ncbi:hypothetical protein JYU34_006871 [Plutella xylostella]|uniref:Tc1-like transposase DDE domain-containing protein n=1 Tax=Plutella xylostella TaxID=51655 RepID=A0ABQ7QT25_PLUXY|nr:hypothetical protein JYU34_006871 [Plutella xylostella]
MNSDTFENWFKGMIEKLPENSVIVMDNASYHSRKIEKIPTANTKKEDIIGWLKGKNILHEENLLKRELLQIVKAHRKLFDGYVIDEYAKSKNISVPRLPPYHCELNPIELIWAQVKGDVAANNTTFKMRELKELFAAAVQKVTPEKWKKCCKHVIDVVEPQMNQMDHNFENLSESFIINVNDSSDKSSESDE